MVLHGTKGLSLLFISNIRMFTDSGTISRNPTPFVRPPNSHIPTTEEEQYGEITTFTGFIKMRKDTDDGCFVGIDQQYSTDFVIGGRMFWKSCLKCNNVSFVNKIHPFADFEMDNVPMLSHCEHACCVSCVMKERLKRNKWRNCPFCRNPFGHYSLLPIFPHTYRGGRDAFKALAKGFNYTNPLNPSRCRLCKLEGSAKCSRCHMARYCSKEHQRLDWKCHKKVCSGCPK